MEAVGPTGVAESSGSSGKSAYLIAVSSLLVTSRVYVGACSLVDEASARVVAE